MAGADDQNDDPSFSDEVICLWCGAARSEGGGGGLGRL
jgi:hypothetical protein